MGVPPGPAGTIAALTQKRAEDSPVGGSSNRARGPLFVEKVRDVVMEGEEIHLSWNSTEPLVQVCG